MDRSDVTDSMTASHEPHEPGRPDPSVVNGVIAAVGVTYVSTHSLTATVVAGCAGLACAAVLALR